MDNALKDLEAQLEALTPRGLSDEGRENCHLLIDQLASESGLSSKSSSHWAENWLGTAAAAVIALSLGISGGWYFGKEKTTPAIAAGDTEVASGDVATFEHLDHEAWILAAESPYVYETKSGEIREISRELEVTKEVVQHRESGVVVTVETTDHHVVDAPKSDF